jgi:hypothetical protein
VEEFGWIALIKAGAEGATAPETLRPMDRTPMTLWKAAGQISICQAHRRL